MKVSGSSSSISAARVVGAVLATMIGSSFVCVDAVYFGHADPQPFLAATCRRSAYIDWQNQRVMYQPGIDIHSVDGNGLVDEEITPCRYTGDANAWLACVANWEPHYVPSFTAATLNRPITPEVVSEKTAQVGAAIGAAAGVGLAVATGGWAAPLIVPGVSFAAQAVGAAIGYAIGNTVGRDKHPGWTDTSNEYYPMDAWDQEDVPNYNQDKMAFTVLNDPGRNAVRHIALFSNGQEGCEGYPQLTYGTNEGWKNRVDTYMGSQSNPTRASTRKWHTGPATLDKRGAAGIFMDGFKKPHSYGEDLRVFDLDHTLVVAMADTAFCYPGWYTQIIGSVVGKTFMGRCNVGNSQRLNNKMLRGWKRWLNEHVWWSNIQGVMFYGMSRGGCFATRFADYLFTTTRELTTNTFTIEGKQHTGTKLILETVDAVCNPNEWQDGVATSKSGTRKGIRSPYPYVWSDYIFTPVFESNDRPFHPKNHAITNPPGLPRSRCNGIDTSKLFAGVDRRNIRWLNTVAGADVVEWDGFGKEIWAFCDYNTATFTYRDSGPNKNKKAPVSEFQNLYLNFGDVPVWEGQVPRPFVTNKSRTYVSKADILNGNTGYSNFPMQDRCDVWYKQYWTPVTHGFVGSGHGQMNTMSPTTNHAPCYGSSSCGFGTRNTWQPIGNETLGPYSPRLNTCVPNPRADMDHVYKHLKHAKDAAAEWFTIGDKQIPELLITTSPLSITVTGWKPNPFYRPVTPCELRVAQKSTQGPSDDEGDIVSVWAAKFTKHKTRCYQRTVNPEEAADIVDSSIREAISQLVDRKVIDDTADVDTMLPMLREELINALIDPAQDLLGNTCESIIDELPLGADEEEMLCASFASGIKPSYIMSQYPGFYVQSPNAIDKLARRCSSYLPGTSQNGAALESAYWATAHEEDEDTEHPVYDESKYPPFKDTTPLPAYEDGEEDDFVEA